MSQKYIDIYNSEGLPIKAIGINQHATNKHFLHYHQDVFYAGAKPGDKNAPRAVDKIADDDPHTRVLDEDGLDKIVKTVDEYGYPALCEITLKNKDKSIIKTIPLYVLPTCVEARKQNYEFVDRKYIPTWTPETTRKQTEQDKQSKNYNFEEEQKFNINALKEHLRRELLSTYFNAKQNENTYLTELIEGLNIINNHYDVSKLRQAKVKNVKLSDVYPEITTGDYQKNIINATAHFSKKFQTENAGTFDVCEMGGCGYHLIGLKKGKTAQDIERYAKLDAVMVQTAIDMEHRNKSIVSKYMETKNPGSFEGGAFGE